MTKPLLLLAALTLTSCNRDQPPAPSAKQADQLNEAEAMLNDMAQNEKGAVPEDTAPSSNQG